MGTIYQRGRVYWIQYHKNGKPIRESTKSYKRADAARLLKRREGEIAEGRIPGVYFDRIMFEELAADLLTDYRLSGNRTLAKAERLIRLHLGPYFEGWRASDITTPEIKEYIEARAEEGAANATINRELAALKRMFNLGAQSTPPKVALVPHFPMLKENNVRKGFFEPEEFQALCKALPDHLKGPALFAYKTGWRKGEILRLKWPAVDLAEGVVRLDADETKNEQPRTVYLDDELKALMRDRLSQRNLGCPYVFHNSGKRMYHTSHHWDKACTEAGIPGRIFHDLRRTAVRNMVRAGVPERVAMAISGHKTRSVFDRYNIVNGEDIKRASRQVQDYLGHSFDTVFDTIGENDNKEGGSQ